MSDPVPASLHSNLVPFWLSHIKIVDNFLSEEEIHHVLTSFQEEKSLPWYSDDGEVETRELLHTSFGAGIINTRLTPFVSAVFGHRTKLFCAPYMRIYKQESFLDYHIDGEDESGDGPLPLGRYSDSIDQCVTLIEYSANIYLNDDYEGGELVFPKLNFSVKPKAGQLIMFPSGAEYAHSVNRINLGERRTVVAFYTTDKIYELYKFMQTGVVR